MRYVDHPDLPASVLGFGCGAVLGRAGHTQSHRALATAWDAGITLFDTARSYGYGEAEGLLGDFLHGRRDRAIISTKFGILPEPQNRWKHLAKPLVRGVLKLAPQAHTLVRRAAASQFHTGQFTSATLRSSLELSLQRLRTDYVDLLFLHSPPASVLGHDDLFATLGRLVAEGKVRFVGISADPPVIAEALRRNLPILHAYQFPANLFDLAATAHPSPANRPLLLANHPFGGVVRVHESRSRIEQLAQNMTLEPELRAKLTGEPRLLLADVVFAVILQNTGIDVVLPAMMNPENLQINVRAITQSRFTPAEAAALRQSFLRQDPIPAALASAALPAVTSTPSA